MMEQTSIVLGMLGSLIAALDSLEKEQIIKIDAYIIDIMKNLSKPLYLFRSAKEKSLIAGALVAAITYAIGLFIPMSLGLIILVSDSMDFDTPKFLKFYEYALDYAYSVPLVEFISNHQIRIYNTFVTIILAVGLSRGLREIAYALGDKNNIWSLVFGVLSIIPLIVFVGDVLILFGIFAIISVVTAITSIIMVFTILLTVFVFFVVVFKSGEFLKEKAGFKRALTAVGFILVFFSFFLQLISTF